jgi:hypothetical protein
MSRNIRLPGLRAKVASAICAPRQATPVPVWRQRERIWDNAFIRLAIAAGIIATIAGMKAGWLW